MKKSDARTIKNNNTSLIFSCLLSSPLSRAEIVRETGLSKATVTGIVNELLAEGQLIEIGKELSDSAGRPAINLKINKNYRYAAGISLHRQRLSVCITNLDAELIDSFSFNTGDFLGSEAALDILYEKLIELLIKNSISLSMLIGIGISSPGPLDFKKGVIHNPGDLKLFHNFDIVDYLSKKTELPIYLDNNSVLLCLLDKRLRKERLKDYIFVVASDGIGSVMVSDGQIFRGSRGYSGELGHTSVEIDGITCECGNKGCLEKYISLAALKSRFNFKDLNAICSEAEAGNISSLEIIDFITEKLSFALINSINLTDPSAVVIYGELNLPNLLDKLSERINYCSTVAKLHKIKVEPSLLSLSANITCTTAAIIKAYFEQRL